MADQRQRLLSLMEIINRSDRPSYATGGELLDDRNDSSDGMSQIRFEVASTDNPLFGLQIDQDQWPPVKEADLRHDRSAKRDDDGSNRHRPQCERFEDHGCFIPSAAQRPVSS